MEKGKIPAQIQTKRLTRRHLSMKRVVHTNLVLHKYVELFSHFDCFLLMAYRKTDAYMILLTNFCLVIDHRRRQNVVRTSVTRWAIASCATFVLVTTRHIICDLLLNRRTATWNLFVNWSLNF